MLLLQRLLGFHCTRRNVRPIRANAINLTPLFRDSFPTISSVADATITHMEQTTETLLNVNPNAQRSPKYIWTDADSERMREYMTQIFPALLVLGIPIVLWLALRKKTKLKATRKLQEANDEETEAVWRGSWLTNSWETLYGLIGPANDDNDWVLGTPLRTMAASLGHGTNLSDRGRRGSWHSVSFRWRSKTVASRHIIRDMNSDP